MPGSLKKARNSLQLSDDSVSLGRVTYVRLSEAMDFKKEMNFSETRVIETRTAAR